MPNFNKNAGFCAITHQEPGIDLAGIVRRTIWPKSYDGSVTTL